jgi:hypothetical protein
MQARPNAAQFDSGETGTGRRQGLPLDSTRGEACDDAVLENHDENH